MPEGMYGLPRSDAERPMDGPDVANEAANDNPQGHRSQGAVQIRAIGFQLVVYYEIIFSL